MMNSRRKTLGGLSPAQVNVRSSVGPARVTKDGTVSRKTMGFGRASLAGARGPANNLPSSRLGLAGPAPRRSSQAGKAAGIKQDPRPISDKSFQGQCIRNLIGYLSTHGYDQPLTPKMLASPIKQDVTNIYHFLMRQVDPNLNPKTLGKLEDDVPALYKRLRYPFQMSKSALFAVGSPHTWPSVLAALAWLTELLQYQEKTDQVKGAAFDGQQPDFGFFQYAAESYSYFLAGDDQKCQDVEDKLAQEANEQQDAARAHIEALQQETADLKARMEQLQTGPTPLEAAQAKRADLLADKAKFLDHIAGLEARKQKVERRAQEQASDRASLREQLAACLQENEAVRQTVAEQAYDQHDVLRMNHERAKLEELLASAAAGREAHERGLSDQELHCERKLNDLDGALQVYHSAASRLQLIPASAKRAGGVQFEAVLNRTAQSHAELVNIDLKGVVKGALVHVRDTTSARARHLAEELLALGERLDASNHCLTERAEESATAATQVGVQERNLTAAKEATDRQLAEAGAQADAVRAQVAQLCSSSTINPLDSQQAISTLQVKYREMCAHNAEELRLLHQDLGTAGDMLRSHKASITSVVESTVAHVTAVHAELMAA